MAVAVAVAVSVNVDVAVAWLTWLSVGVVVLAYIRCGCCSQRRSMAYTVSHVMARYAYFVTLAAIRSRRT